MCGIYASVGFAPEPRNIDIVSHRGPDGRGWRTFESAAGPVALGHRRLAIVDLGDRAAQPMACVDQRVWITFNGEIYNFIELRDELEALGHRFRTTSDTEVLLEGYVEWGEKVLDRLRGMFAFVIYDAREECVFAARDRFGIKPLYYYSNREGFAFASEIKQLVDLPGFSRRLNLARTYDYLSVGFTDHTEETMFADARQLRGGQCVTIELAKWPRRPDLVVRRYYELTRIPRLQMDAREAATRFRALFEDSISLHLRSDVRVGSCLSGGLDSSSIVVMMDFLLAASGAAEPIHTVGACYDDKSVDEKPFMDMVVATTRTEPHFIYPSAERAFSIAERITWHQDEPHYNTSMYAQWCVFEEAKRQHVKVMLDGQGADEELAGYHHDGFPIHAGAMMRKGRWGEVGRMILERKRWHGTRIADQLLALPRPRLPGWLRRMRPTRPAQPGAGWLNSPVMEDASSHGGSYADALLRDHVGPVDNIGDLCVANIVGTSLPKLLRYEDRNSMAHSIEARLPFLDHPLVEFAVGLWDQHKIVGGDTKRVLRRALADLLPEPIRQRRDKIGFATPQRNWFRGPLRKSIEAGVRDTLALFPQLLNEGEVIQGLEAAMDGRKPANENLWMIVNLGIWGKLFGMKI